jgi:hypothetical protein
MEVGILVISIDDRLVEIYNELKNIGYEVHKSSENVCSDVVIYSGAYTHLNSINPLDCPNRDAGVFLINGDGKAVNEIDNMVKYRIYSSLF